MLIIDIETYRNVDNLPFLKYKMGDIQPPANYKDPEKIAQYKAEQTVKLYEKAALSPLTGKIILIGMYSERASFLTTMPISLELDSYFMNEQAMLAKFWDILDNNADIIVSYNGKQFDMPFIYARSLLVGVKPTVAWNDLCNKYNNRIHIDLFQMLGEGRLQEWAYLIGATNTLDSEGNMVGKWFEQGDYQSVIDHCHADLLNTFAVAEKVVPWMTT